MPVPLRFWHVSAMWQAPTKRSGTIHGWQRKIPVIELLTAHFLLTWLSKRELFGSNKHAATLQIFKQMFAISHIGTISTHVSKTGCGMFSNRMLHCFIAVIQTPKSECTPCCMQSGHLLPVLRNSHCGVYEGTEPMSFYIVWKILSLLFFENKFLSYSLTSLSASSPYCKTQPHWQLDHGPCQTVRLQVFLWRFEELDNQSWMNSSATTLKVYKIHLSKLYIIKSSCTTVQWIHLDRNRKCKFENQHIHTFLIAPMDQENHLPNFLRRGISYG